MTYKTNEELKRISRIKMFGQYGVAIGAYIVMRAIIFFATSISVGAVDMRTTAGLVMYYAVVFIIDLISAVFILGEIGLYLKISCGLKASVKDVFAIFKAHPDRPILARLIMNVFGILCYLLSGILSSINPGEDRAMWDAAVIGAFALGSIVYIYISLTYGLVNYLLFDYPQIGVKEAYSMSKKYMKGHKLKLLKIHLGFIPMYALSLLTIGIANLFITPYKKMTLTQFYLDLVHNEQPKSTQADVTA